jgi:hypothetical protein
MHSAFALLNQRLSRIQLSNFTDNDSAEVNLRFENVQQKAVECMKALLIAVHISKEEKQFFSKHARKLADLRYVGDIRKALEDVRRLESMRMTQSF